MIFFCPCSPHLQRGFLLLFTLFFFAGPTCKLPGFVNTEQYCFALSQPNGCCCCCCFNSVDQHTVYPLRDVKEQYVPC